MPKKQEINEQINKINTGASVWEMPKCPKRNHYCISSSLIIWIKIESVCTSARVTVAIKFIANTIGAAFGTENRMNKHETN